MSLYRGNYGHYNSSGNVLYGGYNADKVVASPEFKVALDSYADAKMWTDPEKTEAKNAAMKLAYLPALRRKRYATTSKDERRFLTAQIRSLTGDMTPIVRRHGMQLLREATGARLRPRVSSAAKQLYNSEFVDYPMNDYRNWMSPVQFARGVPNGLYTPNPRPPVKPSEKRIAHNNLLRRAIAAAQEYASTNGWAHPYVVPLANAAMKIAPEQVEDRDQDIEDYNNLYSYMSKDAKDVPKALNAIANSLNVKKEVKKEAAADGMRDG